MLEPVATGPRPGEQRPRPLLRTKLGDVLRRIRLDQGRTLADVARHARVSMPYLSELERGRKEASSEVLAAVCDALRVGLADVLSEVGRDLLDDRAQHTRIIRLDAIGGGRVSPQRQFPPRRSPQHGSGDADAVCLLAA